MNTFIVHLKKTHFTNSLLFAPLLFKILYNRLTLQGSNMFVSKFTILLPFFYSYSEISMPVTIFNWINGLLLVVIFRTLISCSMLICYTLILSLIVGLISYAADCRFSPSSVHGISMFNLVLYLSHFMFEAHCCFNVFLYPSSNMMVLFFWFVLLRFVMFVCVCLFVLGGGFVVKSWEIIRVRSLHLNKKKFRSWARLIRAN